eukprot:1148208-Pelagomonas_calceolata.AAC.12
MASDKRDRKGCAKFGSDTGEKRLCTDENGAASARIADNVAQGLSVGEVFEDCRLTVALNNPGLSCAGGYTWAQTRLHGQIRGCAPGREPVCLYGKVADKPVRGKSKACGRMHDCYPGPTKNHRSQVHDCYPGPTTNHRLQVHAALKWALILTTLRLNQIMVALNPLTLTQD